MARLFRFGNIIIVLSILLISSFAWYRGEITITKGILLSLFGSLTAISFNKLFYLIGFGNDLPGIQKSSPSIDGSISGWRLTSSLTLLLITSVFAALTVFIFFYDIKRTGAVSERIINTKDTALKAVSNLTGKNPSYTKKDSSAKAGTETIAQTNKKR